MIDVKLIKKAKDKGSASGSGITTNGYTPVGTTKNAVYAETSAFAERAGAADEAQHAAEADHAKKADLADLATQADNAKEADHAKKAHDLDPDSPIRDQFLSRINDDVAKGLINYEKGITIGQYLPGVSGGFFGKDSDGDSFAEVAKLYVRVKAFFESLTIIEAGVLSGKQYITPGGAIKCTKVEETDSSYRCYFLSEQDGEKTDCKIIAGDQAIAEFFNAKTGTANKVSNHRFWRLVTAVNNDAYTDDNGNHYGYIELSKTDCEGGSSAPVAGDEICQFGNRLDPTRQSAMVFSTVDADAPSVKLFSGINSFSLEGKAVIAFGCDPASGRVFFRLGASGAAHYLEYIQGKGLVVAGKISVKSTFTNDNGEEHSLGDLITGNDVLYISHTSRTSAPALPTVNASGVITSLNGWSTQSPAWQADKYIWQTTYVRRGDGSASFSDPTCVSGKDGAPGAPGAPGADGKSYAPNLLKESNVVQQTVGPVLGSYEWDEHPAVGTDCTLTVCGKVGPKDNYIELYQNKGYHKIGNFEGRTETVKSFKFKVTEVAGRTTLVDFYRNPNDGDFDSGTYIKWAVITLGDAPQTCWTPAKSEMEGARVFSLQPSTDSVSRNAMGVLSATKVSATKYVTTGDGMATTTEHYLYYRRDSESGTSAWTLGAGVGSPTTPQIDILEDTRSVVFELRDSSGMVLDRERVPVISDAADMKVGGTNLLRNSDFIDGLKYWDNNFAAGLNAVTIPERSAAIGWFDNRLSAKVSHLENSQTWRKLLQPIEKGRIVPGKTYTLSGFVYIPDKSAMGAAANGSTAYRLRASMCYKLKNDTSNHDDSVIDLMQAPEGEWSYMSGRWTAPANLNIEEKVEMAFYLVANGEYYVNGWKLEEGNVPTAWNAAPEDTSYLRSALRENVELNGGLVAATLLNLGITEENGTFRTTAGMNGSTEVRGDRSIAFWAGGDAIDAEKPDDATPAKIVMRHDGTAYFCDNIIRFDENRVEIGKEGSNKLVVLDEDGLKLIDGNEQRLRVVNQSVGTLASVVQSTGVTLNAIDDIRVRRTRNKEVTTISNSGTTRVVGSFTKNFNIGSGNLPVGATVNITGSIYSEFPLINDDLEGFPLLGANARLQIYERQSGTIIFDKKATLGYDGDKWKDHSAKISANVTIPKAGEYRGNLMLEGDGTEGPTYEMTVATATAKVEGSVQLGFSDQTVLGNDGLLSKWGETAWLVRSGEVHAKVGTTEFQILPNGIKAIINGKTTWLAQ